MGDNVVQELMELLVPTNKSLMEELTLNYRFRGSYGTWPKDIKVDIKEVRVNPSVSLTTKMNQAD